MVKYDLEAAFFTRESVNHARLRRLGIEDRWNKIHRSFESMDFIPPISKKQIKYLPC